MIADRPSVKGLAARIVSQIPPRDLPFVSYHSSFFPIFFFLFLLLTPTLNVSLKSVTIFYIMYRVTIVSNSPRHARSDALLHFTDFSRKKPAGSGDLSKASRA